jgi:hypothetical protein
MQIADRDVEVRSYRAVFSLERRIYRIDTIRLNPAGVPLRGVAYAALLAAGAFFASQLPGISLALTLLPWYFRVIALPVALGGLLAMLRIDGRAFHVAATAAFRYRLGPRDLRRLRRGSRPMNSWRPPPIVFVADGSEGSLRSSRYHGPGMALICYAHDRVEWPRRSRLFGRANVSIHPVLDAGGSPSSSSPTAMEIAPGSVLEVSRSPWTGHGHRG